jgi:superfamily I DNA/RNA helicase
MDFLIADTFTDSLGRLTSEEQKLVKTTAFDLQVDPAGKGNQFHRVDKVKDKNFWSVRVSRDIRLIVHKMSDSLLLCYVDHHDKAYAWAERRKLQTHPKTGAAQLVVIRETVQDVFVPNYVESPGRKTKDRPRPLFAAISEEELLGYGVPAEWMADVRGVAGEDELLALTGHLPAEAAEALLELATGGKPRAPQPAASPAGAFEHPDAQRRFRVVGNLAELERALDYPWEKWTVFLHPEQRQLVDRDYGGPARVSGSAGTGKTIVALHRAVHLARVNGAAKVLLTTFSRPLANALKGRLRQLTSGEPDLAARIEVEAIEKIGRRLASDGKGETTLADRDELRTLLEQASEAVGGHQFTPHFLWTEWDQVVDAWQLDTWEAYRDVARLGRKTRLPETQRRVLWKIFERVRSRLKASGRRTAAELFTTLVGSVGKAKKPPYQHVVIDEAQDVSIAQLRFLAALAGSRANGLFFAGDLGQRIFQQPFSWKGLGVDIRGRSKTLRVNYRTSHQIRTQADRLLDGELSDGDGNVEERGDTVSVFNGPPPEIRTFKKEAEETAAVAAWIKERTLAGLQPHEIGLIVRDEGCLPRAEKAARAAKLAFRILNETVETAAGEVSLCTMPLAKGLEFRAVAVMACDDEIVPLQERIESVGDEADLQEVYATERHLLYVACTRARDHLLLTNVAPASEFLDDLNN